MPDVTLGCQWPRGRISCLRRHCEKSAAERETCSGFTVRAGDRIDFQNLEFDAVNELALQWRRLQLTAVVDDDYPAVRNDYEVAMSQLARMMKANGRTL